tara:strand:+ start:8394 stop:8639 length:246 start_codon:yes stop_codon:yes gene_type:complete
MTIKTASVTLGSDNFSISGTPKELLSILGALPAKPDAIEFFDAALGNVTITQVSPTPFYRDSTGGTWSGYTAAAAAILGRF